jgi:aldose 1-epimerase
MPRKISWFSLGLSCSVALATVAFSGNNATAQDSKSAQSNMSVTEQSYGKTAAGHPVKLFTATNANGLKMSLIDYGATMTSLEIPDRNGKMANVILTCPDIAGFEKCKSYFGCTAGRYCNRIAKGKFQIDGKEYTLAVNNGPNHLHGGNVGFDRVMWSGEAIKENDAVGARFKYRSKDGEEGYPGNVDLVAEFRLTNKNELTIDYFAQTDAKTHVNVTNHNYWNLSGAGSGTVLKHELQIDADKYLPVDETMIPTGELKSVADSPLDFRQFVAIGKRIAELEGSAAKGYDHCFVLKPASGGLVLAATVRDPQSGRVMTISTNQPGLQFYSGNFLDGSEGSGGYKQNAALCLETQYFPDTPNQSKFPSSLLEPGKKYHHRTVCQFSIQK